jgi:hypothetical protein
VEVISNVDVHRSAFRSIAWLGRGMSILVLSFQACLQVSCGGSNQEECENARSPLGVETEPVHTAEKNAGNDDDRKKGPDSEPATRTGCESLPNKQHGTIKEERGEQPHQERKAVVLKPTLPSPPRQQINRGDDQKRPSGAEVPRESEWLINGSHET